MFRSQAREPERALVVCVARHDAIAIGDEHALALGVVGDALDEELLRDTAARGNPFEGYAVQRPGAVVMRPEPAACVLDVFRVSDQLRAVERVVARAIRIVRGLEMDR